MLYLYHSNKMESLLQALLAVLEQPLENPFAPETILVQNQGMARWITQGIAERQGIAANLDFPLPATFIWRIFELQLERVPDSSSFDKESLLWRCMALLPRYAHTGGFEEIANYLSGDDATLKCYQL
ncbi:MAG: exodeoxyribonuclease V subunit gamma, partial [Pseudomonadota bacterium]|nr:exodeoxyribonuclease V subunit gamma [Pseudomonadota bacterium]